MNRLTEHDDQGNWCLKGVAWNMLHVGQVITKEIWEKLYGALWKLKDYEDTGLTPEDVERVNDFERSETGKLLKVLGEERKKHRWIPVEERLPENLTPVIICRKNGKVEQGQLSVNGWWKVYGTNIKCVVAWMPLPEPYRPEED